MTIQNQTSIEDKVKAVFKKVLDIKENEILPDAKLSESLGIDSTEMVEIAVVLKKDLGVQFKDNELKKTFSFNEVVSLLKSRVGDTIGN